MQKRKLSRNLDRRFILLAFMVIVLVTIIIIEICIYFFRDRSNSWKLVKVNGMTLSEYSTGPDGVGLEQENMRKNLYYKNGVVVYSTAYAKSEFHLYSDWNGGSEDAWKELLVSNGYTSMYGAPVEKVEIHNRYMTITFSDGGSEVYQKGRSKIELKDMGDKNVTGSAVSGEIIDTGTDLEEK